MLTMNRGGDNRGRETGQRPNLNDPPWRENANERGEKKIVARTDAAGIPDIIEINHRVKEIHLAGRGNFARVTQLLCKLSILDFKLLERLELADIEVSRRHWRGIATNRVPQFS